jgi:hypothetical protein
MKRNWFTGLAVVKVAMVLGLVLAFAGCTKTQDVPTFSKVNAQTAKTVSGADALLAAMANKSWEDFHAAWDKLTPSDVDELTKNHAISASEFAYDLNEAKDGIILRKYTGMSRSGLQQTLIIPATIEDYPVVEIGDGFVGRQHNIGDVILPNTITKIGYLSFVASVAQYQTNIDRVYLSDGLKEIGVSAFKGTRLREINLPDGLKEIWDAAFEGTQLQEINLPNSLERIGSSAFSGTDLDAIVIPDGIQTIETSIFRDCKKLTSVTLPSEIKTIWNDAFTNCSNLTDIIIPDSITAIEFAYTDRYDRSDAFKGCGKLKLAVRSRLETLGYKGKF